MVLPAGQSASAPAVGASVGDWDAMADDPRSGDAVRREAATTGTAGGIAGMPASAGAQPAELDGEANPDGAQWYGDHNNQAVRSAIKALDGLSDIPAIMGAWRSLALAGSYPDCRNPSVRLDSYNQDLSVLAPRNVSRVNYSTDDPGVAARGLGMSRAEFRRVISER